MSCGGHPRKRNPQENKGNLAVGRVLHRSAVRRPQIDRPVLHRSAARLWSQRTRDDVADRERPGADDVGVAWRRTDSRAPPSALSHGVVVATPSWARSTVRQRSTPLGRPTSRTDPISRLAADPGLLLERLGRLQRPGWCAAGAGRRRRRARGRTTRAWRCRPGRPAASSKCGRPALGQHADGVAERAGTARRRGRRRRRPRRRPVAADLDRARRPPSRRRTRRPRRGAGTAGCPCPAASRPSPSTTAYRRSPTRPRASSSTCSRLSPPIDLTG